MSLLAQFTGLGQPRYGKYDRVPTAEDGPDEDQTVTHTTPKRMSGCFQFACRTEEPLWLLNAFLAVLYAVAAVLAGYYALGQAAFPIYWSMSYQRVYLFDLNAEYLSLFYLVPPMLCHGYNACRSTSYLKDVGRGATRLCRWLDLGISFPFMIIQVAVMLFIFDFGYLLALGGLANAVILIAWSQEYVNAWVRSILGKDGLKLATPATGARNGGSKQREMVSAQPQFSGSFVILLAASIPISIALGIQVAQLAYDAYAGLQDPPAFLITQVIFMVVFSLLFLGSMIYHAKSASTSELFIQQEQIIAIKMFVWRMGVWLVVFIGLYISSSLQYYNNAVETVVAVQCGNTTVTVG